MWGHIDFTKGLAIILLRGDLDILTGRLCHEDSELLGFTKG